MKNFIAGLLVATVASAGIATATSISKPDQLQPDRTLRVRENNVTLLQRNYQHPWESTITIYGNYEFVPAPRMPGIRLKVYFNSPGDHRIDVNTNLIVR